ncbi:serine/threonine-protein kinase STY46-like [Lolium perenne]|uniref:serine/threonine-protein kinase STY46-like n=1 Tax=Lolium perenne TaxID=4522 RepID=UPI0021F6945F|nr:serine/threonine-protein kinase STY46-like [Lolium perenne]
MESTPTVNGQRTRQEHRGLRGRLAGIFSSPTPEQQCFQQVAKLTEQLQKQSELKETYKARLENAQEYLRFCLDVAQQHGFLHLMSASSNDGKHSPRRDNEAEAATTADDDEDGERESIEVPPCDPYLAATRDLAVQHGWSVAPEEIELHEKIGRGTTADIHRATWRGLDVAVKWMRPELFLSNPSAEAFFAQELDVLSRQRHPHVLRLMGACLRPPDSCFLVTELLSGATLGEWLHGSKERRRERPPGTLPPLKHRLSRAVEIALAMWYLHEQTPRVLHRDLKPSNVLLDSDSRIRVADFGHARFLPDGTQALTGETGTYVYMAPEVIRCEPYTEKCDVYSFGVILNELVTGEHPYIETSYGPSKIALEVADGKLRPKLPQDAHCTSLVDLICQTWAAEPSRRPSFATIASSLREIKEQML